MKGWVTKRLEEVADSDCSLSYGIVQPGEEFVDGLPVVRPTDLTMKVIELSELKRIDPTLAAGYQRTTLQGGELLLCVRGSTGTISVASSELSGANVTRGIVPIRFKKTLVDSNFGYYLMIADQVQRQIREKTYGAALMQINIRDLRNIEISFPPLAEQQRIVGVLDEAFQGLATARANAEKNLQNARALFESHLQAVFTQRGPGWVETTLDDCCDQIFAGGDVPKDRLSKERTSQYSVPIYSNGEKDDGLYGFTDVARVTEPSITVSARGTLGFTAIRTEPFLPVVRLIVLVPDEKQLSLSFLYYAVVGMDFGNTGTSIPQLTVPNFKESKLHVPSLLDQRAIVERLDALSAETQRLKSLYERKLAALEALKKALLHQAFAGEL
ncbi:MAG: restriction endonuclease subunit S [Verrucomicrobiaceae bacterium]|nr:restriction endonuclease subunit S [Verrucomicrobiaceae bacterium]